LTDQQVRDLIDNRNFTEIESYLRRYSKEANMELDYWIKSVNDRVIACQVILSNADPGQVVSDMLFDDLLNNGVLQTMIVNYKIKVNVNTFPSFWMAVAIMNQLGTRYKNRRKEHVSEVTLKELFVEYVSREALDEMIEDFDNIMSKNGKEKEVLLTNAYICTLMYTKHIHNSNPIVFHPDFKASEDSEYRIDMNAGEAKMAASKGGDGMILIQKN